MHRFFPSRLLAWFLVLSVVVSCGGDEPVDPTPVTPVTPVNPPTPEKDTTAPTITVAKASVNVISGPSITISGNEMKIGSDLVASWKDDKSTACTVSITFVAADGTSKTVNSGDKLSEEGKLKVKVSDEAGNSSEAEITLTKTDSQAPEIEVKITEKNVIAWVTIKIEGNQLFFDDQVAATWKDDYTENCKVELTLEGKTINSGDVLLEAGKLVISLSDDFQNKATAEITLLADAIYGLEGLQDLSLQVDKEVNLLQGITYADGVSLEKVEIEASGNRFVVTDPIHYVPDQTGTVAIIITVKAGERSLEFRVEGLVVNGLDYNAPKMTTANLIDEQYSWYYELSQNVKDFIYPHLLSSYAACNWSKQPNRVHIIMWETTNANWVENIGQRTDWSNHAKEWSHRIRVLCPDVPIKACHDLWGDLEKYIEQHPNEFFIISCAAGSGWWSSRNEFEGNPETAPEERLLNNKITVFWYVEWRSDNYFSPDATVYWWVKSAMPVWYRKSEWNLVMPMIWLIGSNGQSDYSTNSSYPTAVASGVVWNAVSVVMSNNSGITPADAMTIIDDNYLNKKTFQYKDETTNWELVDWVECYSIDIWKLLKNELLQADKLNDIQFDKDSVELPNGKGICYTGKGVQFTIGGQTFDMTEETRATLENAVISGKEITWIYNPDKAKKYSVTDENSITVKVMDKKARIIPDLSITVLVR